MKKKLLLYRKKLPTKKPTILQIFQATIAVLRDQIVVPQAIFVHAFPARSKTEENALLQTIAESNKKYGHPIVLCGLTTAEAEAKGIYCYAGCNEMTQTLINLGVKKKDILQTPPAFNTAEETKGFVRMAKAQKWKKVSIATWPHHQLRCFLQIVAVMKTEGHHLDVYNHPLKSLPWFGQYRKPLHSYKSADSCPDPIGNMGAHTESELDRIITYAQDLEGSGKTYTRHATIAEMFAYLAKRG